MKTKLIGILLSLIPEIAFSVPWPILPSNQPHQLGGGGNYGQYQHKGGRRYFHSGIDIPAIAGTDVYAVESGYVRVLYNENTPQIEEYGSDYYQIGVENGSGTYRGFLYTHGRDFRYWDGVEWKEWQKDDPVSLGDRLCEVTDFGIPWFLEDHLIFPRLNLAQQIPDILYILLPMPLKK